MKKVLILVALVSAFDLTVMAQGGLRYTIQVVEFENRSGWSGQWRLGDAWGAVLTDKLQQSGKYIVIAEQDMRMAAMDEQDFATSGRTAGGSKAPQTGQMTPAQVILKGVISSFDEGTSGGSGGIGYRGVRLGGGKSTSSISGTVYAVDTTTGAVMASQPFEAKVTARRLKVSVYKDGFGGNLGGFKKTPVGKAMDQACDQVVDFLNAQISSVAWSGTVIRGGEDNIIINRGSREGVSSGMMLRCGKAEEIRDPDTGELLDSDFIETAKIQVTRVKEKLCYAKLVSGKAPKKGDAVYN